MAEATVVVRFWIISIIFGLMFATALTLGVVPVLYSLLYRVDITNLGPPAGALRRDVSI